MFCSGTAGVPEPPRSPTMALKRHILVELFANRLRAGSLRVLAAGGDGRRALFRCPALGLADAATALKAGNPARDPRKPFGNAPSGAWEGCRLVTRAAYEPNDGIGPRWIPLHHSYAADEATRHLLNPRRPLCRWLLGIHAGWGNGHLMLTQGCIRVRDEDFDRLAALLGDTTFDVTIVETNRRKSSALRETPNRQRAARDLTM